MMTKDKFKKAITIRVVALFAIVGGLAAILPVPSTRANSQTIDAITPFRRALSGLYGNQ